MPWGIRGWRESAFGLEGIKGLGTVSGESVKRSEKLGFKIDLTYEYFHSLWQNHMKEDCPEEELRDKVVSGFKS